MTSITDTIADKTTKLNNWQSFVILLLLVAAFLVIPILTYVDNQRQSKVKTKMNSEMLLQLIRLNQNIEKQNINIVDYNTAVGIYTRTITKAMYLLTRKVMTTISENHINVPARQTWIRFEYQRDVYAMFKDDTEFLNKIIYKDKRLGAMMEGIDIVGFTDKIFEILFDETMTKIQRRKDVERYLNTNIPVFIQVAKTYLND
jgi:hypothetical protein